MHRPTPGTAAAVICAFLACPGLTAQRPAADLWERLDAKLAEPWLANATWITDFGKAKEIAAREGRHILAYFTRSYAP